MKELLGTIFGLPAVSDLDYNSQSNGCDKKSNTVGRRDGTDDGEKCPKSVRRQVLFLLASHRVIEISSFTGEYTTWTYQDAPSHPGASFVINLLLCS